MVRVTSFPEIYSLREKCWYCCQKEENHCCDRHFKVGNPRLDRVEDKWSGRNTQVMDLVVPECRKFLDIQIKWIGFRCSPRVLSNLFHVHSYRFSFTFSTESRWFHHLRYPLSYPKDRIHHCSFYGVIHSHFFDSYCCYTTLCRRLRSPLPTRRRSIRNWRIWKQRTWRCDCLFPCW